MTLSVRLSKELEDKLNRVSKRTRRSKSSYIKQALEDLLQDEEDYLVAMERLKECKEAVSLEDVKKEFGL